MSLSTTPSLPSVRPSFASGYASPLTGGMAHPDLWRGVVGAWCPSLGATGSTLRDLSGNHNHGTLTNFTLADAWADPNGMAFDGSDDQVQLGNPETLQLEAGPISIAMWSYDNAGTNSLITKGESRASTFLRTFDIFDTGSQLRFHGLYPSGVSWAADTTTRPALGEWHHVVATWDGTTGSGAAKLYVDGLLAGSATPTTASLTAGDDWFLGGEGGVYQFDGAIDDVRIYSRALPQNEVATLYRLGPAGIYQQKRPVITTPTVEPAGSVGAFITSEVKPSYASGYASPITGGMAHESLWDGVVGAWCPSLGATGGTLRDLSGNHNHGTYIASGLDLSEVWSNPEGFNFAQSRQDRITVADSGLGKFDNQQFSVSAWINLPVLDTGVDVIFSYNSTAWSDPYYATNVTIDNKALELQWNNSGAAWDQSTRISVANAITEVDRWYFVTATFKSGEQKLYVDGAEIGSNNRTDTITFYDEEVRWGSRNQGAFFTGLMDGMVYHRRALTAPEVATLYRLGPAGLYQQKRPVITTAEEVVVGGLPIPIAAYHYNHNVGSRL